MARRARRATQRGTRTWLVWLAWLAIAAIPGIAAASAGEVEWTASAGSDLQLSTAALDLSGSYWWRDLIALDGALVTRWGPRAHDALGARVGLRIALDALTFCPWLGGSVGALWQRQGVALAWRAEAGVSYRPSRSWALHMRAAYEGDCCGPRLLALVGVSWFGGGASELDF